MTCVLLALTGCNKFGYDAGIDQIRIESGSWVLATGWFHDGLAGRGEQCPTVRWQIDGQPVNDQSFCGPHFPRPDLDAKFGGTNGNVPGLWVSGRLRRGVHLFCLDVVPAKETAAPFVPLDCQRLDMPWDQFSTAWIDEVTVTGSSLDATGWQRRVTFTTIGAMYWAGWFLDDTMMMAGSGVTHSTEPRPDVEAAVGPGSWGMRLHIDTVAPGQHTLCLRQSGPWGFVGETYACRSFTV